VYTSRSLDPVVRRYLSTSLVDLVDVIKMGWIPAFPDCYRNWSKPPGSVAVAETPHNKQYNTTMMDNY